MEKKFRHQRLRIKTWQPFVNSRLFIQVIFEAVVGDGYLGDIAIDEVALSTASCNAVPSSAEPGVSSLSGKCLKIVNHSKSGI